MIFMDTRASETENPGAGVPRGPKSDGTLTDAGVDFNLPPAPPAPENDYDSGSYGRAEIRADGSMRA
jgi:hypothetical protein